MPTSWRIGEKEVIIHEPVHAGVRFDYLSIHGVTWR